MRAGLTRSIGLCVVGAVLVLVAQAVTWSRTAVARPAGGVQHVSVTGHDVASSLPAIGWALLALALALLAANGLMRRAVGALVVVVGITAVAVAVAARSRISEAIVKAAFAPPAHPVHASAGAWWAVAAVGGLIAALGGALAVAWGGRWGSMGSRYETPVGAEQTAGAGAGAPASEAVPTPARSAGSSESAADDAEAWRALDRGEDPTAR